MRGYWLLVCLLVCSVSSAAPPTPGNTPDGATVPIQQVVGISIKIEIAEPAKGKRIEPGDLVILDYSKSDADAIACILANSDKKFLNDESKRKIGFSTGTPGRYIFVVVAGKAGPDGKPILITDQITVQIGDPDKKPGPINPPGPGPLPEGKYNLATDARRWFGEHVKTTNAKTEAKALSKAFSALSSQIGAGTIKTPDELTAAAKLKNREALGESTPGWVDWFTEVRKRLDVLSDAGTLTTIQDYQTAWDEIQLGLESVSE